jgi:HNH endonuclease
VGRSRHVGCGGARQEALQLPTEVPVILRNEMSNQTKKERWVREAVAITDALPINGDGRYLCPLCLKWFADLVDLSLEHAPPESVGGRHIAVTCRDCNSTAGHTVDAELRLAETIREFGSRRMTKPMSATFRFNDVEQRVEALFCPDGLSIAGVPKQNRPDGRDVPVGRPKRQVEPDPNRMAAGRLPRRVCHAGEPSATTSSKAAIIAGAVYLYIFREELEEVRRQIREPAEKVLDRYCVTTQEGPGGRRIAFVRDPAELESVVVLSNACAVFLPSDASAGTYERLAALDPWPTATRTLSGPTAPWPTQPVYAADRAALNGRSLKKRIGIASG